MFVALCALQEPTQVAYAFGGQDLGIAPDDVHKFEAAMKQQGKKIEIRIYEDAGHAFENPDNKNPPGYRAADTAYT